MKRVYCILQKLIEKYFRKGISFGYVFMFHNVYENVDEVEKDYLQYSISRSNLQKLLQATGAYSDTVCNLENNVKNKKFKVYFTFDDGFESVYSLAKPLFEDCSVSFTVFVTTGFIGKSKYLSAEQLAELSNSTLCTIGCHTKSHACLRELNNQKLNEEILLSKEELENKANRTIAYFAFPYGALSAISFKAIRMLKKSGFKLAFSTICLPLKNINRINKYIVPRCNVNDSNVEDIIKTINSSRMC